MQRSQPKIFAHDWTILLHSPRNYRSSDVLKLMFSWGLYGILQKLWHRQSQPWLHSSMIESNHLVHLKRKTSNEKISIIQGCWWEIINYGVHFMYTNVAQFPRSCSKLLTRPSCFEGSLTTFSWRGVPFQCKTLLGNGSLFFWSTKNYFSLIFIKTL